MLCYRCGSHVPDGSATCPVCGQSFASGGVRQTTGTFSRRKLAAAAFEGAPWKPGDVVAGRYHVKDCTGQGPVGFVFRAMDKEVDVEVALKAVSPKLLQTSEERRAFAKELKAARKLNHNNICRIYEEGEFQDRPFYTTQYLDGLSLRKIIDLRKEKGQFFKLEEIEPILAQVAAALDEAHRAGVVHGDLKPDNVLVLPDLLKVTDFGLGMAMPRQPFVAAQKSRKAHQYIAPEYVSGGEVSSAIDVYAMGAILGEMLGGALPEGDELPELKRLNPAVTGQLDAIFRKACNSNPQARYSRAQAFANELALLAGTEPGASLPNTRPSGSTANGRGPGNGMDGTTPGRRPPSRRPPPPPVAGPPTGEIEVTPAAPRPPPPVPMGRPNSSEMRVAKPMPPPPVPDDPVEALPTQSLEIGIPTQSIQLPDAVDANGVASEEPTQAMAPSAELLRAATAATTPKVEPVSPGRVAVPIDDRPTDGRGNRVGGGGTALWWLIPVIGLVAGVGGGYAYLQHVEAKARADEKAAQEKADRERMALEVDAGSSVAPTPTPLAGPHDAGPETSLFAVAAQDAGSAKQLPTPPGPGPVQPPNPLPVQPTALGAGPGGCPANMAFIPAGQFKMGSSESDPLMGWDEKTLSTTRTAGYCIDIYEYPNQEAGRPLVNVTFKEAEAACSGQGKRLCSEPEWERACKGPSNSRFTYGDAKDNKACSMDKQLAASGSFPRCKSGYGVFDLSGNAAEWTSSVYAAGAGANKKTVKGAPGDQLARCAGRRMLQAESKQDALGFRCCADAKN